MYHKDGLCLLLIGEGGDFHICYANIRSSFYNFNFKHTFVICEHHNVCVFNIKVPTMVSR